MEFPKGPKPRLYVGAVLYLGLLAVWLSFSRAEYLHHVASKYREIIALLPLVAISQFANLRLFGPTVVSMSFPFVLLSLLLAGPGAAIISSAVAALVHGFYPVRRPLYRIAFNFASLGVATTLAWIVYTTLGGVWHPSDFLASVPPLMAAVATCVITSTVILSGALSVTRGQPLFRLLSSNYRLLLPYYLAQGILVLIAAISFEGDSYVAAFLALLSLTAPWSFIWLCITYFKRRELEQANLERLTVLATVATTVNRARGLHPALREVMSGACHLAGADASSIFLIGPDGGLHPLAEMAVNADLYRVPSLALTQDECARLTAGDLHIAKSMADAPQSDGRPTQPGRGARPSAVYLPLWLETRHLGVMGLYFRRTPELAPEVLKILSILTEYAAIELDRHEKTRNLADSSWRLFRTEERIRRDISAHLHGPVQTKLLVLWHHLGQMCEEQTADDALKARLDDFRARLMEVQEHVRTISSTLYPAMVKVGLKPALQSLAAQFQGVTEVTTAVTDSLARLDATPRGIPEETRLVIYRVVEEALTNAAKHANATQVRVRAWLTGNTIKLYVRDNGVGFRMDKMAPGLGIRMMEELGAAAGGSVSIESSPSAGTSLELSLPINPAAARNAVAEASVDGTRALPMAA